MPRTTAVCLAGAALLALWPAPALFAQDGFLFRAPEAQITFRAGPAMPRGGGDVFDFMTSELTLQRGDFTAAGLSGELSWLPGNRWEVGVSLGMAESNSRSEYRHLICDDGLPIAQTTKLRMIPASMTGRYYLLERGRTLSSLAWIPARTTPYIGAGAGVTWYTLLQEGEFVERETNAIFRNRYESQSQGLTVHAVAGANHWLTPRVGLNAEARYTHGSAELRRNYGKFDRMDLGGLQATLGLSLRW
jgi:hypothetical protein